MADVRPLHRLPLLALGLLGLTAGVFSGLRRLGWGVPWPSADLAAMHGALMVAGFFGTVIALERAVALAQRWAYAGPLATGLGVVALVVGARAPVAQTLLLLGSAVLLAASVAVLLRQRALFTFTLLAGAGCLVAGDALWLRGAPLQGVVPSWIGFLVLTIAGERLELSRFLRPSAAATGAFALVLVVLLAGIAAASVSARGGVRILGGALLALSLWLGRHDVARRTVRKAGLTRFTATCLLAGYVWLAVGAAILLVQGGLFPGSFGFDAALHALMLGFVLSMVLGHAPIIVPAVARVALPYHPVFYGPLALLHVSLAVRVAGDAVGSQGWRAAGGLLNALAILAFVASTLAAVLRGRLGPRPAPPLVGSRSRS